jgi:hypothetical protein
LGQPQQNNADDFFEELIHEEPIKIELKDEKQPMPENDQDFRNRNITKISYDM